MASLSMGKSSYIIHPYKFNLWLFILSLIMVFGGLTSAYIVARSMVDQPEFFDLPKVLWYNTALILVSSVTMQMAAWAARRGEEKRALLGLVMTFILGNVFLVGQWQGFLDMTAVGNYFVNSSQDKSVSFFYVLTGLHALHIVSALVVVLVTLIKTVLKSFKPGRKVLTYEISATFWHFLDLLWVYLFLFLLFTQR